MNITNETKKKLQKVKLCIFSDFRNINKHINGTEGTTKQKINLTI